MYTILLSSLVIISDLGIESVVCTYTTSFFLPLLSSPPPIIIVWLLKEENLYKNPHY